jgi:hypothetical protein
MSCIIFIFISGCSVKTTPIYAVIKTPTIKIADQGFIKEGFGYKKIIIYKAANAPIEITIKNSQICMNGKCIDKERFIKNICKKCPNDLFDKVLNKQPLTFLGKITKTKDGFIQKKNHYYYKVAKNRVLLKTENSLIMIKDLK